jgi:hypothetical protein
LRHGQKLGLKLAQEHMGALDQGGHFIEQGRIVNGREALFGSGCMQLARDLGVACGKARNHCTLLLQLVGVVVGTLQHHGVNLGLKTVAMGLAARLQAQHRNGHHLGAMQGHQAMGRAHEVHTRPAIGELVLHDLGDGQLGQRGIERLLQALGECGAGGNTVKKQSLSLAIHLALELGQHRGVQPQAGEFFGESGGGLALGAQGHAHGHELL